MQLGIFAKTFIKDTFEEVLDEVVTHKLSSIQFNMVSAGLKALPEEIPTELAIGIGKSISERNLSMAAVSGTFNMIHPDPEERNNGLRSFEAIAGSCQKMNTNLVSLCTGTRDPDDKWKWHEDNNSPKAWEDLFSTMEIVLQIAEIYNLKVGIEPEHSNIIRNARVARRFLDELANDRVGIILDPANLFEAGEAAYLPHRIDEAIDLLGPDIILAHAKDKTETGLVSALGEGAVPLGHFIQSLDRAKYEGTVIMHGITPQQVASSRDYMLSLLEA